MIELGVIDLSAEGRRRLLQLVERWILTQPDARQFSLPRISLQLLAPQEVRFNGAIDLCVIGPELVGTDAAYISQIRQQLPGKILLCVLDASTFSFGMVEQLGRLGVDDVLMASASSEEFFRRLVLLKRRVAGSTHGDLLVVDAARGGVGATFLTAALAEGSMSAGKRVCVVDTDVISQDLTRFLQVRPFVSEPLRLLIDCQRVVTVETVQECTYPVWSDEPGLRCMPPAVATDEAILSSAAACRTFISVLEVLQTQYDTVVVDAAPLLAGARQAVYQVADQVVFVLNRDPAGVFAHRQALSLIRGCLKPNARLTVAVNENGKVIAPIPVLKEYIAPATECPIELVTVPYSAAGARWACSGRTPFRVLKRPVRALISTKARTTRSRANLTPLREVAASVLSTLRRRLGRTRTGPGGLVAERATQVGAPDLAGAGSVPLLLTAASGVSGPPPADAWDGRVACEDEALAPHEFVSKAVVSG
jgi:MinD-like ATPase involved in chromosome partitioning or flagellar assembly